MKTEKLSVLEKAMGTFLDNKIVGDGKDGYISASLHLEMAKAAEQVYDSAMNTQSFMKREGYEI